MNENARDYTRALCDFDPRRLVSHVETGIAQVLDRLKGGVLHDAELVAQRLGEWLNSALLTELAQRHAGGAAHPLVLVGQRGNDRIDGARIAQTAKRFNGDLAHGVRRAAETRQQGRYGA